MIENIIEVLKDKELSDEFKNIIIDNYIEYMNDNCYCNSCKWYYEPWGCPEDIENGVCKNHCEEDLKSYPKWFIEVEKEIERQIKEAE